MVNTILKQNHYWRVILFLLICLSFLQSCGFREPLPQYDNSATCELIEVAPGPEDFVLDNQGRSPRFLISTRERRGDEKTGGIYSFDPDTQKVNQMKRSGDKGAILSFSPHGMDIRYAEGRTLLYVIVHDPRGRDDRFENAVAIYEVSKNSLTFVPPLLEDKRHLWSPNDLSVMANGEIYLTNDYRTMTDLIFKRKNSEVVHYNPTLKTWSIAASELGLANGIIARQEQVYISTTTENTLYAFPRNKDGSLGPKEIIIKVKGLDNIMPYEDKLIVTAHFDDLAFLKHKDSQEAKSPTVIFLIDPVKKTCKPLYADDGEQYSAASTALIHDNRLYASQVFNSFLLVCDIPEVKTK